MEITFIYGLKDPRYNVFRYIGKSDNPQKRYGQHLSDSKTAKSLDNRRKNEWIKVMMDQGYKPELVILEEVRKSAWKSSEKKWIQKMKDDGQPLLNLAPGGGYIPRKKRARKKRARKKRARKQPRKGLM